MGCHARQHALSLWALILASALVSPVAFAQFPMGSPSTTTTPANCQMIQESGKTVGDHTYTLYLGGGGTPVTVYCDMTTDGGGWTLIGRGREGWVWSESGQSTGNAAANISTTSAFTPSFFPSSTVDRIMRSVQTKDLPDGIRIKRAADVTGSTWQEVRLKPTSQTTWSWIFSTDVTGLPLSWASYDGVSYGVSGNSHDFMPGGFNGKTRIFTYPYASHNNQRGFSYGFAVNSGDNLSSSYLWEYANEEHAIPYTEVYVRPRYPGTLAFSVAASTAGNVNNSGSFGLNFDVGTQAIRVVAVGYFAPSGAEPPSGTTITVGIFDRTSTALVSGTQKSFTMTSPGILLPGTSMRVTYLNPPVTLAASGQYSVVAQGYGATYYLGASDSSFSTTDGRSGLISFTGARSGGGAFGYPPTAIASYPRYGAGTFLFLAPPVSTPLWMRMPNTTTYAGAEALCTSYGRRLCYRSEYCPNGNAGGETIYGGGKKTGDQWAPVKDVTNNWVAVGTSWPSCQLHTEINGGASGMPSWSTNTAAYAYRNWVLCCP